MGKGHNVSVGNKLANGREEREKMDFLNCPIPKQEKKVLLEGNVPPWGGRDELLF